MLQKQVHFYSMIVYYISSFIVILLQFMCKHSISFAFVLWLFVIQIKLYNKDEDSRVIGYVTFIFNNIQVLNHYYSLFNIIISIKIGQHILIYIRIAATNCLKTVSFLTAT